MSKKGFDFTSLGISPSDWEVLVTEEKFGYEFSTPYKGVLKLKTVGHFEKQTLDKIFHFINNYALTFNEAFPGQNVILIWNTSAVYYPRNVSTISAMLNFLNVFQVYFVTTSFRQIFHLKLKSKKQSYKFIQVFDNCGSALNQAIQTLSVWDVPISFNKLYKFYSYWAQVRTVEKIIGKNWKYVEMPSWQYRSEDGKCKGIFRFYDHGIMYYELKGILRGYDVSEVQRRILVIAEDLSIDLHRLEYNLIIVMDQVHSFSVDARRLLRHMELRRERTFKKIVLVPSKYVWFLIESRKRFAVNNYFYWITAKSTNEAFRKVMIDDVAEQQVVKRPIPSDYEGLKKEYDLLRKDYKRIIREEKQSNRKIKNLISFINSGNFLNVTLQYDYSDHSLGGLLYNSLVLLNNDLRSKDTNNQSGGQITFSGANIEQLLDNISEPILIYQDKYIKYVNYALAKMLGFSTQQINGQPISSIVDAYELNRIAKQLQEINIQQRFDCILMNVSGNPVSVSFIIDTISIDEYPAQFIFVRNDNKQVKHDRPQELDVKVADLGMLSKTITIEQFINKAVGGAIAFFVMFNRLINKCLLSDYDTPHSYDLHKAVNSLMVASDFIRESVNQSYSILANNVTGTTNPNDIVTRLYALFVDYISVSNFPLSIEIMVPKQMVKLDDKKAFIVQHIMMQLMLVIVSNSKADRLQIGYRLSGETQIGFFIQTNVPKTNIDFDIKEFEIPQLKLTMKDIHNTLTNNSGKFKIHQTKESGTVFTILLPGSN